MEKKKIKIKFVNCQRIYNNSIIYKILNDKYIVELSNEPDYVFYLTNYDDGSYLKYTDAIRIYYNEENLIPNFNLCDYALSFNIIEFGDRHMFLPNWFLYENDLEKCQIKHQNNGKSLANRDFCSFVYSNKFACDIRNNLFKEISKYKAVSSGGKLFNNQKDNKCCSNKIDFENNYKFSIACENSYGDYYVTEKIIQSFAAKTIPIYYGGAFAKELFNDDAYINVSDYKNMDELIKKIEEIDNNDDIYLKMLSTPAFKDENYIDSMYNQLSIFFENIFDNKKEDAFRRNKDFHGVYYTERAIFNDKLTNLYRVYHHFTKKYNRK